MWYAMRLKTYAAHKSMVYALNIKKIENFEVLKGVEAGEKVRWNNEMG